eukprot:gene3997-6446_t
MASLQDKIIKQVEYYFSDRNYPRDKFMQETAKKDDEQWIPLPTIMTFNKLKALTTDESEIVKALRAAPETVQFELNENGDALRRDPTKPIASQEELDKRTVYVKGFDAATISVELVANYFKENGFDPEHIQIRKHFKTKENKREFVATAVDLNDVDLELHLKQEYLEMKAAIRREAREKKKKEAEQAKQEKLKETIDALMQKDRVLRFVGVPPETSREDLKDVFEEFGEIAWIDFSRGETEGFIRYGGDGAAPAAVKAVSERNIEINGKVPDVTLLQGEAEKDYWMQMEKTKNAVRKEKRQNIHKRRKGGRQYSSKRSKSNA